MEQNRFDDYKEIVLTLSKIIEEENEYLKNFNIEGAATLLEQKTKTIQLYRSAVAFLIKNPAIFEGIEEKEKLEVREVSVKLDELLKQNDILLKTRMETSKTVVDSIINLLKTSNATNSTSYGSGGTYNPLEKAKNAIAINQTL